MERYLRRILNAPTTSALYLTPSVTYTPRSFRFDASTYLFDPSGLFQDIKRSPDFVQLLAGLLRCRWRKLFIPQISFICFFLIIPVRILFQSQFFIMMAFIIADIPEFWGCITHMPYDIGIFLTDLYGCFMWQQHSHPPLIAVQMGIHTPSWINTICSDVQYNGGYFLQIQIWLFSHNRNGSTALPSTAGPLFPGNVRIISFRVLGRISRFQREHGSAQEKSRWAYTKRLNTELGIKIARAVTGCAEEKHANVIVFEYLETKGKISGRKKQKLHLWRKRDIQKRCEHQAHRRGMRISRICAWNTSRLAYDDSGTVVRDPSNHSLYTFQNGKSSRMPRHPIILE